MLSKHDLDMTWLFVTLNFNFDRTKYYNMCINKVYFNINTLVLNG